MLHPNSKGANIMKAALRSVTFRKCFSYSKAAQYLMHSTGGCATSRRVSIIQAKALSAVRGSDVLGYICRLPWEAWYVDGSLATDHSWGWFILVGCDLCSKRTTFYRIYCDGIRPVARNVNWGFVCWRHSNGGAKGADGSGSWRGDILLPSCTCIFSLWWCILVHSGLWSTFYTNCIMTRKASHPQYTKGILRSRMMD